MFTSIYKETVFESLCNFVADDNYMYKPARPRGIITPCYLFESVISQLASC